MFLSVKDDECDSDAENEQNHDPNVEEFLHQQDTAIIYPEAPDEDQRQGTPEASGQDENGKDSIARCFLFKLKGCYFCYSIAGTYFYWREHYENQNVMSAQENQYSIELLAALECIPDADPLSGTSSVPVSPPIEIEAAGRSEKEFDPFCPLIVFVC